MASSAGHPPDDAGQDQAVAAAPGRELLLHVGMHKTGTTSIQKTFGMHAAVLQEAGYYWYEGESHSRVVYSAFADQPQQYHLNRRAGLAQHEDALVYGASCRARLLSFLAEAPGPRLLISGEDIAMLRPPEVQRMLAAFRPLVDRITVIGFVRAPRSYIGSAIQEQVRGGAGRNATAVPQYRRRFAAFRDAPEVAELRLKLYAPESLLRGCSVATFLQVCGAPPELVERMEVRRANPSRSRLATVLLLAANDAVPVFLPDGTPNPERVPRLAGFLERLEGSKFQPPEALVVSQLHRAAEDIAWMEGVLGSPFADSEKAPQPADAVPVDDLDSLSGEELRVLVRALNGMLRHADSRPQSAVRRSAGGARGHGPQARNTKRERQET
jgi:hypothetical protein